MSVTCRVFIVVIFLGLTQITRSQSPELITTFLNPVPAYDGFGYSIAAMGSGRVIIGGTGSGFSNSGVAYLFATNGTLQTEFVDPSPSAYDRFGSTVVALGSDRAVIGDFSDGNGTGAAYLFDTNGTLLTTFTNPTPAPRDRFGFSLATGWDRVVIGADQDDTGATVAGAAYLFSTNGTLLTTINNPAPSAFDHFGCSVAMVDRDRIVIGALGDNSGAPYSGSAYVFSTNGTLLTTISNPTPAEDDRFGSALASVGTDRILIGAWRVEGAGALDAGAAYLFDVEGALLTTFANPAPAIGDRFGSSVAAVGSDRVIIGAWGDNTGANDAGAVYLFGVTGTLLATITNPTPAIVEFFGQSVAALDGEFVFVGASSAKTAGERPGEAYMFDLPPLLPSLSILPAEPGGVTISWTQDRPGLVLQETEALSPTHWSNSLSGVTNPAVVPVTQSSKFFRVADQEER